VQRELGVVVQAEVAAEGQDLVYEQSERRAHALREVRLVTLVGGLATSHAEHVSSCTKLFRRVHQRLRVQRDRHVRLPSHLLYRVGGVVEVRRIGCTHSITLTAQRHHATSP
jgi:hypothetical protein